MTAKVHDPVYVHHLGSWCMGRVTKTRQEDPDLKPGQLEVKVVGFDEPVVVNKNLVHDQSGRPVRL